MLSDATYDERLNFLRRIWNAEPRVAPPRRTQEGDPSKQDKLRASLPLSWLAWRLIEGDGKWQQLA